MSIKKSIEDLPRSGDERLGTPPSRNPWLGEALAEAIVNHEDPNHPRDLPLAIPEAGPYRGSYGAKRCDRALWYAMKGEPESNPPTEADLWTFLLGHTVHDLVQKLIPELNHPEIEVLAIEPEVDLRSIGVPGSSHVDMLIRYQDRLTLAVEIKSINGFAFKRCATTFSGPPEGPKSGHSIQAALSAAALEADGLIVIYLSLEKVGKNLSKSYSDSEVGRFSTEWRYSIEEMQPIIKTETARIQSVANALDAERPIPRRFIDHGIPEGAIITDPSSGMWMVTEKRAIVDTGDTWMCGYCPHQDRCIADGA